MGRLVGRCSNRSLQLGWSNHRQVTFTSHELIRASKQSITRHNNDKEISPNKIHWHNNISVTLCAKMGSASPYRNSRKDSSVSETAQRGELRLLGLAAVGGFSSPLFAVFPTPWRHLLGNGIPHRRILEPCHLGRCSMPSRHEWTTHWLLLSRRDGSAPPLGLGAPWSLSDCCLKSGGVVTSHRNVVKVCRSFSCRRADLDLSLAN